jgi:hypothetical protein
MYDYIDRPVTQLDPGGRFLIWSMRSWVRAMRGDSCPATGLAPAFAKWKMIGGLQPFNRTMLLLDRDALETFRFCSLGCNRVSEHEAIIISLIATAGRSGTQRVTGTLALIVEEDSIGDLLQCLCELARAMSAARLLPGSPAKPRA